MKRVLCAVLAVLALSAFAQSSSTTGTSGTSLQINGMVQSTVGDRTVTIAVGNGFAPKFTNVATPAGQIGVQSFTSSAGLSIGAVLGSGFGSTGGTAGSVAGALAGF